MAKAIVKQIGGRHGEGTGAAMPTAFICGDTANDPGLEAEIQRWFDLAGILQEDPAMPGMMVSDTKFMEFLVGLSGKGSNVTADDVHQMIVQRIASYGRQNGRKAIIAKLAGNKDFIPYGNEALDLLTEEKKTGEEGIPGWMNTSSSF